MRSPRIGADVGVIQGGGGASFAAEAFESLWILGDVVGKEFESDEAAEGDVFGFVDHTHSATAQLLEDAVVRYGLADHGAGRRMQW